MQKVEGPRSPWEEVGTAHAEKRAFSAIKRNSISTAATTWTGKTYFPPATRGENHVSA